MANYYVDPSVVTAGNGLTPETAYKYLSSLPTSDNHTFYLRADGLLHRPAATIPTGLTGANIAKSLGQNITVTTYGTGNPTVSGAVEWTGAVGSDTINSLTCKVFNQGVAVNPYWFPRTDRVATYPSICCPTDDDGVDSFIDSPADFDNIQQNMAGFYFPGAANWGGNTDPSKDVYYTGSSGNYTVTIRAPGFWARANAEASLIGKRVVMRTGANYTNFFPVITAYDAIDGSVTINSPQVPFANPPANNLFFYALVGHPYGLRQNTQYALLDDNLGWVVAMDDGSVYDIACYSSVFLSVDGDVTLDLAKTWYCEAVSHGNDATRGGALLHIEDGNTNLVSDISAGPIVGTQMRNFGREGAIVNVTGNGSVKNVSVSSITQIECMGVRIVSFATGGSGGVDSGPSEATGPLLSMEGAGGIRISGAGSGITISDVVVAPRASIHDNGGGIYQEVKNATMSGIVIPGNVNPFATQWNKVVAGSPTTSADNNRTVENSWFSGRPLIDLSGWATINAIRHDDGGTGALYDRVIGVGADRNYFARDAEGPNTGMVVQRCILDKVLGNASASLDMTGITFRHCVFSGAVSQVASGGFATITEYLEGRGATVENCLESEFTYAGTITDDMWQKLTLNDTFDGYEAIDPWLAPQLGMTLPAYGSARTIVAPVLVHAPLRPGQPAGSMYGAFINPNPLAQMSLPSGVGDNDKLESSLYAGYNVIPSVPCPDQATFTIALDVTDAGATNGPLQRYLYEITIGSPDPSPDPDPTDPPPPEVTRGSLLRLRLFG